MVRGFSVVVAVIVAGIAGTAASATNGVHRFFLAPGRSTTSCELASAYPSLGTFAYCQIGPPGATSVTMSAKGTLKVCRGARCLGNPPDGDRTLAYGEAVTAGPFQCTAEHDGIRCTVRSGLGFLIGPAGLKKL